MRKRKIIGAIIIVVAFIIGWTLTGAIARADEPTQQNCATEGNRVCGPVTVWQHHPSNTYFGIDARGVPIRYTWVDIENGYLTLMYYNTPMAVVAKAEVKHVGDTYGWGEVLRAQPAARCY